MCYHHQTQISLCFKLADLILLPYLHSTWRLINRTSFNLKLKRPVGGVLIPYHSFSITPNREIVLSTFNRKMFFCSTTRVGRKNEIFFSPSNHSANERLLRLSQWEATAFPTPNFLQWTLFTTASLNSPCPLLKNGPLLWTCEWFGIRPYVLNCKLSPE